MAAIQPPVNHAALLRLIHTHLRPRTYVEIGVAEGYSFAQVQKGTLAIGIDPNPLIDTVWPGAKLFSLPSDEFFASHDLRAELHGRSVDVAFIDGMHHFEFALRDFMNLERFCGEDSVILIHDCYPIDRETSARQPVPGFWSGDIWKLIVCLKQHRPDLAVSVVDCPPTGLGIVTNLDPGSTVLEDRYDEICETFIDLDYSVLDEGKEERLNRVPNDWELVRALLPPPASDSDVEPARPAAGSG